MITPAYESFVNDICTDNEYNIANENAIVDGVKKIWETIKTLWKKFISWVTSMVQKFIGLFKKPPKEATADEINKADKEAAKESGDSKFDKNTLSTPQNNDSKMSNNQLEISKKYRLSEKADSREAIRKKRDEMTRNNQSKDYRASMDDEVANYRIYVKEAKKKQAEAQRVKAEQEAEAKKKQEEKWRKEQKARDKEIVKKVIVSEDAFYWITNAQNYVKLPAHWLKNAIDCAKDPESSIDEMNEWISEIEDYLKESNPNDLHTLEDDYINGNAGNEKTKKVGYMGYDNFLTSSQWTVNHVHYPLHTENKAIQNISEVHDIDKANAILNVSKKLIPYYQQILNNVNAAIQSVRVVNIRREEGYGKSFG